MDTELAKRMNKLASHNPRNFRAEAIQRKLEEKAAHWAETHSTVLSQNILMVEMPDGTAIKTDRSGAISLLVAGWSQYRDQR